MLEELKIWPTEEMTKEEKWDAIIRLIIVIGAIGLLMQPNRNIVIITIVTIIGIYVVKNKTKEGLEAIEQERYIEPLTETGYDQPTASNPLSNVLIPDYEFNPNKKPAPPTNSKRVTNEILKQAKQMVINENPGQPDLAEKLFNDLGSEITFEQSMRPFYSTANTTIPNDQEAFAKFCYGNMISCKENGQHCERNNARYTNP